MKEKFFRSQRGSITLFVLIAMLFFVPVSVNVYTSNEYKQQQQIEEIEQIKKQYEVSDEEQEKIYEELQKEDTISKVELYSGPDKTYYEAGESIDYTGIKLKLIYEKTGEMIIDGTTYVTGYTTNTDSTSDICYIITVKYGSYTFTCNTYKILSEIKVGDYINYEPDSTSATTYSKDNLTEAYTGSSDNTADITQDTLNWQILKIYEDGSMDLIGSPTTQTVYFQGARGYNNGVYVMDDICKTLYSREGIEARSVDLEDFESNLTEAGKKAKSDDISNRVSSITTRDYITNVDTEKNEVTCVKSRSYYPILYGLELENGISMSDKYYTKDTLITEDGLNVSYKQAETLTVPINYYSIAINITNYGEAYKPLTASDMFWVASRMTTCDSICAYFGLRSASTFFYANAVSSSANGTGYDNNRLRPVVSLGAGVQVTPCWGENGTSNTHTITY